MQTLRRTMDIHTKYWPALRRHSHVVACSQFDAQKSRTMTSVASMRGDDTHVSIGRLSLSVVKEADRCVLLTLRFTNLTESVLSVCFIFSESKCESESGIDVEAMESS